MALKTGIEAILDQDENEAAEELRAWIPFVEGEDRLVLDEDGRPKEGIDPETGEPFCDFHLLLVHCDADDEREHFQELFRQQKKKAKGRKKRRALRAKDDAEDFEPTLDEQRDFWVPKCIGWVGFADNVRDEQKRIVTEPDPSRPGKSRDVLKCIEYSEKRAFNFWRRSTDFSGRLMEASKIMGNFLGENAADQAGRVLEDRAPQGGGVDQEGGTGGVEPPGAP